MPNSVALGQSLTTLDSIGQEGGTTPPCRKTSVLNSYSSFQHPQNDGFATPTTARYHGGNGPTHHPRMVRVLLGGDGPLHRLLLRSLPGIDRSGRGPGRQESRGRVRTVRSAVRDVGDGEKHIRHRPGVAGIGPERQTGGQGRIPERRSR